MASHENTIDQFGLLIAYIVPGFMALWGVSYFVPEVHSWMGHAPDDAPTVGGFLYMTVASITAGLTVSTVRWLIIDTIHHWTGVARPALDFSRFAENVVAYNTLNEIHYRYYQFYGNSLISLVWLYVARRMSLGESMPLSWIDTAFLGIATIFFLGSRDTLKKFYARTEQFLRQKPHASNS